MKDSLKAVIPNALKGKREGDRKWKRRKLLIGDIQCEPGRGSTDDMCKAIGRAWGPPVHMLESVRRRDGG